jgi:hypothetical protein
MAYRNKTYIAFDGDEDINHFYLMQAWSANDKFGFEFNDAHDLNTARDDSQAESIKRQLRERFANSKDFVVLIGEKTRLLRRFVPWEIETAIRLDLPIVAVNLNGSRRMDDLVPPALKGALAVYVPFKLAIIEHALEHWPESHRALKKQGKTGAYFYQDSTYSRLGI